MPDFTSPDSNGISVPTGTPSYEAGLVLKENFLAISLALDNRANLTTGGTFAAPIEVPSGAAGQQAISYAQAYQLVTGTAGLLQNYNISTTVGGTPASGTIRYNNATQTSATEILMSVFASDGLDLTNFIAQMGVGDTMYLQDETDSVNFQRWVVTSVPVIAGGYATIGVSILASSGTGASNFPDAQPIIIYGRAAATPVTTDQLPEGSTNLYFTQTRVRSTPLTGLFLGASQVIADTDTVLQSLGYLQAQITGLGAAVKTPITVSASRALADSDHEHLLLVTGAYTLTANSGLRADFRCRVQQTSASQVTFANGTATFRNSYGIGANAKTAAQYATAYIEPGPSSTELAIIGDITA